MKLNDFKRKMRKFGVTFRELNSGHLALRRDMGDRVITYTVAIIHGNRKIRDIYVRKARRRMELTPDDGISDEAFDAA